MNHLDGGTGQDWSDFLSHGFTLADRTTLAISYHHSDYQCTGSSYGTKDDTICIFMFVDVNGLKKPNTIGKDIYVLFVHENRVEPYRTTTDASYYRCNSSNGRGLGCSARWLISDKEEASNYAGES